MPLEEWEDVGPPIKPCCIISCTMLLLCILYAAYADLQVERELLTGSCLVLKLLIGANFSIRSISHGGGRALGSRGKTLNFRTQMEMCPAKSSLDHLCQNQNSTKIKVFLIDRSTNIALLSRIISFYISLKSIGLKGVTLARIAFCGFCYWSNFKGSH